MAPSYLQDSVISPASSRLSLRLRSADTGQLYVLRTRNVLGGRAFAVAGPRTSFLNYKKHEKWQVKNNDNRTTNVSLVVTG